MNDMTKQDYQVYTYERVRIHTTFHATEADYLVRGPLGDSFAWCYTEADAKAVCGALNAGRFGDALAPEVSVQ